MSFVVVVVLFFSFVSLHTVISSLSVSINFLAGFFTSLGILFFVVVCLSLHPCVLSLLDVLFTSSVSTRLDYTTSKTYIIQIQIKTKTTNTNDKHDNISFALKINI